MKNYVNLSEEELSVVEGGASAKCILGTVATFYLASGLNPAALIATGIIAAASFCQAYEKKFPIYFFDISKWNKFNMEFG